MNYFSKLRYIILAIFVTTACSAGGADRINVVRDVQYLESTRSDKLDVYMPLDLSGSKIHPGFVCIHGGGWMNLSKSEGRSVEICTTLAKAGFVALSIDYKMGPGSWPTDLYDCKNAVRFLKAHAKEYNVDPSKIAVCGSSINSILNGEEGGAMIAFESAYRVAAPVVHAIIKDWNLYENELPYAKP